MHVELDIRGIHADERWRANVEDELGVLNGLIPIAQARISIERQREATPPFQVLAMLAVPGPDIRAAARDHTWSAAWQKVVSRLRQQIQERRNRQVARRKGQSHLRRAPVRRER